jgi:hypothetical protein
METLMTVFVGIGVRIFVPVTVTALLVFFLGKLDARWKAEAQLQMATSHLAVSQKPCWEVRGCSEKGKKNCKAYANPNVPCWQTFRNRNGNLREGCLDCSVFHDAPEPIFV